MLADVRKCQGLEGVHLQAAGSKVPLAQSDRGLGMSCCGRVTDTRFAFRTRFMNNAPPYATKKN